MKKNLKIILFVALSIISIVLTVWYLSSQNIALLNPKGSIADQQTNLLIFASALSLIVVIPVFTLAIYISWKYRASNKSAKYSPEKDGNRLLETTWWLIPSILIVILSVVTWKTSHQLDPFKPLEAENTKPLKVQVVALEWKWLFIYPEQNIATVNYVQFPEKTPVNFEITADAPMNSFWIPQLGGQIYAMSGMTTKLHLIADQPGEYDGRSANLSGEGFSGMKFKAKSSSQSDFDSWINEVKQKPDKLTAAEYVKLAKPSSNTPPLFYSSCEKGLYGSIINKYMSHNQPETSKHQHSEQKALSR